MFNQNVHPSPKFQSQLLSRVLAVSSHRPWWSQLPLALTAPTFALALLLLIVFGTPLHVRLTSELDSFTLNWQITHTSPTPVSDQAMLAEEQDLLN
jgi:hypothetical protein